MTSSYPRPRGRVPRVSEANKDRVDAARDKLLKHLEEEPVTETNEADKRYRAHFIIKNRPVETVLKTGVLTPEEADNILEVIGSDKGKVYYPRSDMNMMAILPLSSIDWVELFEIKDGVTEHGG